MAKIPTQDELQYLEHCNKLIRETRASLAEIEKEAKQAFDMFLPIMANYVNGMRQVQHDFVIVVRDILKSSKELDFVVHNHRELTAYTEAIEKLAEVFKKQEVQDIFEMIRTKTEKK